MRPQLFRLEESRFAEVPAGEAGPYFAGQWLGRPAARLDWNRDGREDLIVGHLDDDSVLLTNTTANTGQFLSLKLVGAPSHRDAIGTTVRVRIGDRTLWRQLTAGDGYQASNERQLVFGLGDARQVDELTVHWPSGLVQSFPNVAGSQHVCLVEGRTLLPLSGAGSSP